MLRELLSSNCRQLNIRLSYHDWLMFKAIVNNFPTQAREAIYGREQETPKVNIISPSLEKEPVNIQAQMMQLMSLGFARQDCSEALQVSSGNLDEAAIWLTQNATPIDNEADTRPPDLLGPLADEVMCFLNGTPVSFSTVEIKTSAVNICIIDDCKDADVPLLETTLSHLHMKHGFRGEGQASSTVSGSYYNRALSSWEPFPGAVAE